MVTAGLLSSSLLPPFRLRCAANSSVSIAAVKGPKLILHSPFPSSSSLPSSPPPVLLCSTDDPSSLSDRSPLLTSSVGYPPVLSPPQPYWSRHELLWNIIACTAAFSASWLFLSAIPTLLAFKRAAESLEKLLDVTREELPGTMAAVRLSGMEISDLTMELSDLGQEITQGVRSSTRAVRLAEDRLRRLTSMSPAASVQVQATTKGKVDRTTALARGARSLREAIVKGRAMLGALLSVTRMSRAAWNFLTARRRKRLP